MGELHVDDFVDRHGWHPYARWFFFLARLPAHMRCDFAKWIDPFKLFCTWRGVRYRVTGASRMGDVWLAADHERDCGYDERVALDECTDWSDEP